MVTVKCCNCGNTTEANKGIKVYCAKCEEDTPRYLKVFKMKEEDK